MAGGRPVVRAMEVPSGEPTVPRSTRVEVNRKRLPVAGKVAS